MGEVGGAVYRVDVPLDAAGAACSALLADDAAVGLAQHQHRPYALLGLSVVFGDRVLEVALEVHYRPGPERVPQHLADGGGGGRRDSGQMGRERSVYSGPAWHHVLIIRTSGFTFRSRANPA
jgi:hypothetical protein